MGGTLYFSPSAIFLTVPLKTFPDLVLGNLFTTIANLKAATGPTFSRTKATHSLVISLLSLSTPAYKAITPIGSCPFNLSAIPITAHSATFLCSAKTSSIAPVDNLCPATLMISSVLDIIQT